jgi:adenylate cyclase
MLTAFVKSFDLRANALRLALAALPLLWLVPHVTGWRDSEALTRFEAALYDSRVRLTMPGGVDPRIVIVDIDERSQAREGRWPWSRKKLATLLDQLFDRYHVKVVGFDAVFSEPEEASAIALLSELQATTKDADTRARLAAKQADYAADQRFSEALIARDVVLGFAFKQSLSPGENAETGSLPSPIASVDSSLPLASWPAPRGFVANLKSLQVNATSAGFFDTPAVDADGVVRRMATLQQYRGGLYESLGLATARLALGIPQIRLALQPGSAGKSTLQYIGVGTATVPVDEHGAVLIPFRGPVGSFPYVSATQVLHGEARAPLLRGAIVLVGTSAAGLNDVRPTPVNVQYNGVEAHANLVAGIVDDAILARPDWSTNFTLATLSVLWLIFALLVPRVTQAVSIMITVALLFAVIAVNFAMWLRAGIVLPLAAPLIYVVAAAMLILNYVYFVESRRKRRMSRLFGQYIPPAVVAELDASEAEISLEGESRDMTVLFSDVRGFTTLSEGLSPRELTRLMNELLTPLTRSIQSQRGTIDKYMGDAIMAFWGAPLPDADHTTHAVRAAFDMIEATARMRDEFSARGWPPVHIGVGISTGPMNVGNMGSQFRMAYTVLGDTVNLGSRLEGLTKQYGASIIVSAATAERVPSVLFRPVDLVRVKGKLEPVEIFEPVGLSANLPKGAIERVAAVTAMIHAYRRRRFAEALQLLEQLDGAQHEKLLSIYRERIAHFTAHSPAADWDGVFVHETK